MATTISRVQDHSTPPVVVMSEFYGPKHSKREWVANNYIDNKNHSSKSSYKSLLHYSGRETESEAIKKQRLLGYLEYQNQDFKVTSSGHFTKDGMFSNQELKAAMKKEPEKYNVPKESNVWSTIVSFSKEFFEENQIMKKEDAYKILTKTMNRFFLDNHIDPKSMTWIGQFHVDTAHHYHVHLRIHQNSPGHFNRKTKKDEWRIRGKWSKSSLLNFRKRIEEVAVANKLQKEKTFKLIGKRDMVKYEVLGTLSNSSTYSEFQDLAYKLKASLPKKGRVQVNSRNIDIVSKIKLKELTNRLLESNERIKTKWQELTKAVDDPIDLKLKKLKLNLKSKYGRAMSRAHELLRKRKKTEVRDHIQNQILKLVIKNNWRPGHSVSKIREINKSSNSKYVEAGFNKARNKSFKKFSKNQFWDPLIFEQEKDTNEALSTIARDLEKFKEAAKQQESRRYE